MLLHFVWLICFIILGACKYLGTSSPKVRFETVEKAQAHLIRFGECTGCDLRKAELAYTNLSGVNLRGANLQGCDLTRANLEGANLEGALMKRCDLSTETNLKGANLSRADLSLANLKGALTEGANFCEALMPDGTRGPCPSPQKL